MAQPRRGDGGGRGRGFKGSNSEDERPKHFNNHWRGGLTNNQSGTTGDYRGRGRGKKFQNTTRPGSQGPRNQNQPGRSQITQNRSWASNQSEDDGSGSDTSTFTSRQNKRSDRKDNSNPFLTSSNNRRPSHTQTNGQSNPFAGASTTVRPGSFPNAEARFNWLKEDRKRQRERFIAEGKMLGDGPVHLSQAITMVGICPDMCAEYERAERIFKSDVQPQECTPETRHLARDQRVVDEKLMVKIFHRPAAGMDDQMPSDLRPPKVLAQTLDYLFDNLLETEELPWVETFLWDRTRSVRNDFSIQQVTALPDVRCQIECYERIARWHLLSMHHMAANQHSSYDLKQDRDEFGKTLTTLGEKYEDNKRRYTSESEAEIRAYEILIALYNGHAIEYKMGSWSPHVLQDGRVQTAKIIYQAGTAVVENARVLKPSSLLSPARENWVRFWKTVRSNHTSYLMACLAELSFAKVRWSVISSIFRCTQRWQNQAEGRKNEDWGLQDLTDILGFDDDQQTREYCQAIGFEFGEKADGTPFLDLTTVRGRSLGGMPAKHTDKMVFSKRFVESKRAGRKLSAVIKGLSIRAARDKGLIDDSLPTFSGGIGANTKKKEESLFVTGDSDDEEQGKPVGATSNAPLTGFTPLNPSASPFQPGYQQNGVSSSSPFSAASPSVPTGPKVGGFSGFGAPTSGPFQPSPPTTQPFSFGKPGAGSFGSASTLASSAPTSATAGPMLGGSSFGSPFGAPATSSFQPFPATTQSASPFTSTGTPAFGTSTFGTPALGAPTAMPTSQSSISGSFGFPTTTAPAPSSSAEQNIQPGVWDPNKHTIKFGTSSSAGSSPAVPAATPLMAGASFAPQTSAPAQPIVSTAPVSTSFPLSAAPGGAPVFAGVSQNQKPVTFFLPTTQPTFGQSPTPAFGQSPAPAFGQPPVTTTPEETTAQPASKDFGSRLSFPDKSTAETTTDTTATAKPNAFTSQPAFPNQTPSETPPAPADSTLRPRDFGSRLTFPDKTPTGMPSTTGSGASPSSTPQDGFTQRNSSQQTTQENIAPPPPPQVPSQPVLTEGQKARSLDLFAENILMTPDQGLLYHYICKATEDVFDEVLATEHRRNHLAARYARRWVQKVQKLKLRRAAKDRRRRLKALNPTGPQTMLGAANPADNIALINGPRPDAPIVDPEAALRKWQEEEDAIDDTAREERASKKKKGKQPLHRRSMPPPQPNGFTRSTSSQMNGFAQSTSSQRNGITHSRSSTGSEPANDPQMTAQPERWYIDDEQYYMPKPMINRTETDYFQLKIMGINPHSRKRSRDLDEDESVNGNASFRTSGSQDRNKRPRVPSNSPPRSVDPSHYLRTSLPPPQTDEERIARMRSIREQIGHSLDGWRRSTSATPARQGPSQSTWRHSTNATPARRVSTTSQDEDDPFYGVSPRAREIYRVFDETESFYHEVAQQIQSHQTTPQITPPKASAASNLQHQKSHSSSFHATTRRTSGSNHDASREMLLERAKAVLAAAEKEDLALKYRNRLAKIQSSALVKKVEDEPAYKSRVSRFVPRELYGKPDKIREWNAAKRAERAQRMGTSVASTPRESVPVSPAQAPPSFSQSQSPQVVQVEEEEVLLVDDTEEEDVEEEEMDFDERDEIPETWDPRGGDVDGEDQEMSEEYDEEEDEEMSDYDEEDVEDYEGQQNAQVPRNWAVGSSFGAPVGGGNGGFGGDGSGGVGASKETAIELDSD